MRHGYGLLWSQFTSKFLEFIYVSRHKEYDNCRERHLFLSSLIRIMVINIPFIAMVEHGILKHMPR
jgi:hypothetical protein